MAASYWATRLNAAAENAKRVAALSWPSLASSEASSSAYCDGSVATATRATSRRYAGKADARYAHTIDPRSGQPVRNGVASVTVLHAGCMQADALATALTVLGERDGLAYAERQRLVSQIG